MFSCEYCEFLRTTFLIEHLRWLLLAEVLAAFLLGAFNKKNLFKDFRKNCIQNTETASICSIKHLRMDASAKMYQAEFTNNCLQVFERTFFAKVGISICLSTFFVIKVIWLKCKMIFSIIKFSYANIFSFE